MRKLLALLSALASPALAQTPAGVINAPIYATGYISQVGGTNITTKIAAQPNHPTNLNIYTTSAITGVWTIQLPNPAFEGQVLSFNCGATVNTISIISTDGSSIDSNLPTTCVGASTFSTQFDQRANIWRNIGYSSSAGILPTQLPAFTGGDCTTTAGSVVINCAPFVAAPHIWTATQSFPKITTGSGTSFIDALDNVNDQTFAPASNPVLVGNNAIGNGARAATVLQTGGGGIYGVDYLGFDISTAYTLPSNTYSMGRATLVSIGNANNSNAVWGEWVGANSPSRALGHTWGTTGANNVAGLEVNFGNRYADLGILTDLSTPRFTAGVLSVPDDVGSQQGESLFDVSSISGGVVTMSSAHNFTANMGIAFRGGSLPSPLVADTPYYVAGTVTGTTFQLSASPGSATLISTTGSSSGSVKAKPAYPGSFGFVAARSIWGHQMGVGYFLRSDTIAPGGYGAIINGNSLSATNQPWKALDIKGYFSTGIDLSGGNFTVPMLLADGQAVYWVGGGYIESASNKFGINKFSPAYTLDVNGEVNASGYRVGGFAGYSGTKVAGACTLVIAGGLVIDISGC